MAGEKGGHHYLAQI